MVKMRDESPRVVARGLEEKAEVAFNGGEKKKAMRYLEIGMKALKKGEHFEYVEYRGKLKDKYDIVKGGGDPYAPRVTEKVGYSLLFGALMALLVMFYGLTGNVVGEGGQDVSFISGLVFVCLGVIGYFVLKVR